jgi:transposase InsO family protein
MEESVGETGRRRGRQGSCPPRGAAAREKFHKYPFALRLRAVKLHVEEGFPAPLVAEQLGVGLSTVTMWARRWRTLGEDGLRDAALAGRGKKLPPAVREKITRLKQKHASFGVRRISQILRRMFFLPASPETVRRTLHEEKLIEPPKARAPHNPPKPRFFERAVPNQLWQSDIFTFRLGGRQAYLIAFLDDYSRYVTGLGMYRSQTAEAVLEVYRRAVSQYGVPKEMLTDNGRQYTNWRGKTRYEQELEKERIHHIKSSPHHPMTLGKVERFWKSIWTEYLCRAQFGSFEEAQERTRLWVQYYNHKRPHQGIGGLCPADRFYEIQNSMRQAIEQGIQENILELALRGRPRDPFYMVGRLGEQSVVIRAEKGKLRMIVDGEGEGESRELVYEVEEGVNDENAEQRGGAGAARGADPIQCAGEMSGGVGDLGRAAQAFGGLSGTGNPVGAAQPVAGSGDGGYAQSFGAADENGAGEGPGPGPQAAAVAGAQSLAAGGEDGPAGIAAGQDSTAKGTSGNQGAAQDGHGLMTADEPLSKGAGADEAAARAGGPIAGRTDCAGTQRGADGRGGGPAAGDESQDVLQMGAARLGGDDGRFGQTCRGAAPNAAG